MSFWKDLLGDKPLGHKNEARQPFDPNSSRTPDMPPWEPCDALFVFDADEISDRVSGGYGAYAQGAILKALSAARAPEGGWRAALIYGCDGDLLEQSFGEQTPGFWKLGSWFRQGTHAIDATLVDFEIADLLQLGKPTTRTLYLVGLEPPQRRHVIASHKVLLEAPTVGYFGVFILEPISLTDVANSLGLVAKAVIQGSECTGWLASEDALREAGLYVGKLRYPG